MTTAFHYGIVSFLAMGLSLLGACSAGDQGQEIREERFVRGDTVVFRFLGENGSGPRLSLVEELRIGDLEGSEEVAFGNISLLAADGSGGVFIFDNLAPALRHFGPEGGLLATLGAEGEGPGEYRTDVIGLHALEDGRVLLADRSNYRMSIYGPGGEPESQWPLVVHLSLDDPLRAMVVDTRGEIFLKEAVGELEPGTPFPVGFLQLSQTGELLDSVFPPELPPVPAVDAPGFFGSPGFFGTERVWELGSHGDIVIGVNDEYAFEIRRSDGTVVRVEMEHEPIALHEEERAEWGAFIDWLWEGQVPTGGLLPVPSHKPAYKAFSMGEDGRIWVQVYASARRGSPVQPLASSRRRFRPPEITWGEQPTFDVFEPSGNFLGRVQLPERVKLARHSGTEVWGILFGEADEQYLVRYRMEPSGGEI